MTLAFGDTSGKFQWNFLVQRCPGAAWISVHPVALTNERDLPAPAIPAAPSEVPHWNASWPQDSVVQWYGSTIARSHCAFGWPLQALWCEPFTWIEQTIDELRAGIPMTYATRTYRGVALRVDATRFQPPTVRVLPMGIAWPGFLLNTVLYAVVWLALLELVRVPGRLRVRRRNKADSCCQCGYSLHGLTAARCPECGTPFLSSSLR